MYIGKVEENYYLKMVELIGDIKKSGQEDDNAVQMVKTCCEMVLDFLAPRDNNKKRDFTALNKYLATLQNNSDIALNKVTKSNAAINTICASVDTIAAEFKSEHTQQQQTLANIQAQIADLQTARQQLKDDIINLSAYMNYTHNTMMDGAPRVVGTLKAATVVDTAVLNTTPDLEVQADTTPSLIVLDAPQDSSGISEIIKTAKKVRAAK